MSAQRKKDIVMRLAVKAPSPVSGALLVCHVRARMFASLGLPESLKSSRRAL